MARTEVWFLDHPNHPRLRVRCEVTQDAKELGHLIWRAARNKGRKAKAGPITVTVLDCREALPEEA